MTECPMCKSTNTQIIERMEKEKHLCNECQKVFFKPEIICTICRVALTEESNFDSVVCRGDTLYFHKGCGNSIIIDKIDSNWSVYGK